MSVGDIVCELRFMKRNISAVWNTSSKTKKFDWEGQNFLLPWIWGEYMCRHDKFDTGRMVWSMIFYCMVKFHPDTKMYFIKTVFWALFSFIRKRLVKDKKKLYFNVFFLSFVKWLVFIFLCKPLLLWMDCVFLCSSPVCGIFQMA